VKISISGIRGVYGSDLSAKDVFNFCSNFSNLIKSGKCVIGRDTRPTGKIILENVSAALMQNGINVYNLEMVPTPVVFREAKKYGAGIVVTSSHNPIESNGLKFILEGRGITENELDVVKIVQTTKKEKFGKETKIKSDYVSDAIKIIGQIKNKQDVTVDIGGGAARNIAPLLLEKIGCTVKSINENLENSTRGPDPTTDNLSELIKNTKKIGFAFDLDSDRLIIVNDGKKRSSDITLGLGIVKAMQLGYKKFVLSIDSSLGIEKYILQHGGQVWKSKVGEANVVQQIIMNNADAGGEGSSGGFILPEFNMCRDGILTSGLIASMFDQKYFQEAIDFFENYFQIRTKIPIPSISHDRTIERIIEKLQVENEVELLDGVKIMVNDNSWALIRKSNTEDIIRLSVESNDLDFLKDKQREITDLVNESYEEIK
jgi:phosphomannomutase|tara:strand:- start:440 stop:1729 length:1290 start_codon:yes stop_codon:yes gene_type:complete